LRIRIARAYENGEGSLRQLAQRFSVSLGFVQELVKRYHETGSLKPRPHGGGYPEKINQTALDFLIQLEQKWPNATLKETRQRLEQDYGVKVSLATVYRALKNLKKRGLIEKKNFSRLRKRQRKN
jgi:transposase